MTKIAVGHYFFEIDHKANSTRPLRLCFTMSQLLSSKRNGRSALEDSLVGELKGEQQELSLHGVSADISLVLLPATIEDKELTYYGAFDFTSATTKDPMLVKRVARK